MKARDVVVVGSFMMDMVARVPHWPRPGESVFASEFGLYLGGKGCNQAIAAARCGAAVAMIGRLGTDAFGDKFVESLAQEGVAGGSIVRDPDEGTGIALPILDPTGQNMIIVAPRANMRLTVQDVQAASEVICSARVLLLQMEVPLAASLAAAALAREVGTTVLWNVAPAAPVPDEALALSDVVIVNEGEAAALTKVDTTSRNGCLAAAQVLLRRGAPAALVTLGAGGALRVDRSGSSSVDGYRVPVVDTTGAGDAFCGALATAIAEGQPLDRAMAIGNAAGAIAVGQMGAAASLPHRAQIEALLPEWPFQWRGSST